MLKPPRRALSCAAVCRAAAGVGTAVVSARQSRQIANELNLQYRIVDDLPAGVKPNERVDVRVKRNSGRIQAPPRVDAE